MSSEKTLESLSAVCRALILADKEVERAEELLSEAKERARVIREETGPSILQEIGVTELKLADGSKVSIKTDVFSQIPKEERPAAYKWLDEHDFGGLIKTSVNINFTRGELDKAKKLASYLKGKEFDVGLSQDVHAQTLKAFLREQIAAGTNIPLDLFYAKPVTQLKIK